MTTLTLSQEMSYCCSDTLRTLILFFKLLKINFDIYLYVINYIVYFQGIRIYLCYFLTLHVNVYHVSHEKGNKLKMSHCCHHVFNTIII